MTTTTLAKVPQEQNPFPTAIVHRDSQTATGDSEQSRAIAEVQSAMVIAKRFPRDERSAMDRILNSCDRPTLANSALYSYSRGGSDITGPSIRLAEALAQNWGNIQFGIRELEQRDGESTIEAFAWDVETNTRQERQFQVRHERHTRQGAKLLTDPRDIYELVANQGARRLRACILGVIPGDVAEAAVSRCEQTMKANADCSSDAMKKMVDAFTQYGVTKQQIEKRIQRRLDAIQPAQVVNLKKIYASLRDGMSAASDWFEGSFAPAKTNDAPPARPKFQKPAKEQEAPAPSETKSEKPAPVPTTESTPIEADTVQAELGDGITDPRDDVAAKLVQAGIKEIEFLKHLREKHQMSAGSLRELTTDAAFAVLDMWEEVTAGLLPQQADNSADNSADNKEAIATALRDMSIAQGPFMQGLAKVHADCNRNWTKVDQLPAEMAAWIVEAGLDTVLSSIRLKGVKL